VARTVTRPPSAKCTLPMYIGFLLAENRRASCCRLGEVMAVSHDSVNRFLLRESYGGKDLFDEAKAGLDLEGGTLAVDDTVLDKPYSQYMALVDYFWSGKHHRTVKGVNLVTLYYTDRQGRQAPVNFRVVDKAAGKTKNDLFLEMLEELLAWGLRPAYVTGDSWYASLGNLKRVRHHRLGLMFGVEGNRLVSVAKGTWAQVQALEIPEEGLAVWLKDFGWVKLFRTWLKDQPRHYVCALPETSETEALSRADFLGQHARHWHIEAYHRAIKQVCNIERFQVRAQVAVTNHLFAALMAFVKLQQLTLADVIDNCYAVQRDLFKEVVAGFIARLMPSMSHLNPVFHPIVNA
jgi:Transposase DDE domain